MFKRVFGMATFEHYSRHIWPIIEALRDAGVNASMFSTRRDVMWGEFLHPRRARTFPDTLWIVAGSVDSMKLAGLPTVYVEHGAGQAYSQDSRGAGHMSYSDGTIGDVCLFVAPNEYVAARRRRSQPDVPTIMAGPTILDEFHSLLGVGPDEPAERIAALAVHWDCQLVPESRSALDHYQASLVKINLALRRQGIILVGHAHPRIAARARRVFAKAGIDWWDYDDVMHRASVMVVDNSSIGYEFASLDRPTVWLNAPWYRRHVHHGLRFWECVPGEQVDEPGDVVDAVVRAFELDPFADRRREIVKKVYPVLDGWAAGRAAQAIIAVMDASA